MKLYILYDEEPVGGHFSAQDWEPVMKLERKTVSEVRLVENFPDEIWNFFMYEGGTLPIDANNSNDSTWREWWSDGVTTWKRDN